MTEIPAVPETAFEPSAPRVRPHPDPDAAPVLEPGHLDALWFQVTGTVCNLRCAHCFVSCAPDNRTLGFLSLEDVRRRLEESVPLGVREYYFTGGEPFAHPDIVEILSLSMEYGPTTVLTNGTLFQPRGLAALAGVAAASRHSLEFRVSIDGFEAAAHDALRGEGSFEAAMEGVGRLLAHGFRPIVTAVRTWDPADETAVFRAFVAALRERGYEAPRIKLMPALRLGAEADRSGGYGPDERIRRSMIGGDADLDALLCSHARIVTDAGIRVCPILADRPDADLGGDLAAAAAAPFRLSHGACSTCWLHGSICANPGAEAPEAGTASDRAGIRA